MLFTNFKLIWRNIWKHANISAINIIGLSVSLAISTLIVLFLQFEYSFDVSEQGHENNYRLTTTFKYPNSPETQAALSSAMMGPYLQRESNEIEQYLRVVNDEENFLCRANENETVIQSSLQVDSSFFSFFNYPLLFGDASNVFDRPENILLTRPLCESLFGKANPIGQTLQYTYTLDAERDTTINYIISAVFDHLPANSHLQFDALRPLDDRQYDSWDSNSRWHGVVANTYFRLRAPINDVGKVAAKFPALLKKEMPNSEMIGLSLQSVSDIHLGSMHLIHDPNNFQKFDRKYMYVFGLIAFFILLISSINFANLSTVLAMRRVQEVGVRKSLGATKSDVLGLFLGEALLMSVIGGTLALIWVELLHEPFLLLLGRNFELAFTGSMISTYIGVVVFLAVLAGIFPAIQATRYSAVQAFQRMNTSVSIKRPFVKRLVIVQFMLSGILIIGSIISYEQLSFLQNKDLGFHYTQVMELDLGLGNGLRSKTLKRDLASISGVIEVSGSDASLGTMDSQNGVMVRNEETRSWENYPMSILRADHNYFDLYEMQFVSGRAPTLVGSEHEKEFVVNESFVKKVGWKGDPIGQEVLRAGMAQNQSGKVVGVIKDIHHNTLHNLIQPICFQASQYSSILAIKISPEKITTTLEQARQVWNNHIKDRPFNYNFKDEQFAQLYMGENRLGKMLIVATALSILIACLGLLALSSFIIQQRTKEIGIRKVLGASIMGIVGLLSKDFLKLVLIALVIAAPLAYYFMEKWLQDFAYRIEIQWWIFVLAGIVAIVVAFLTVSFQSIKAAIANPVNSLKSE